VSAGDETDFTGDGQVLGWVLRILIRGWGNSRGQGASGNLDVVSLEEN